MNFKSIKKHLGKNFGYISVGIVCAIFMLTAFLRMGRTGKTVGEIVTDGAICFFLGCFINRTLDLQGIFEGERDERVINSLKLHEETVERISPNIEKLDAWCEDKNSLALRMQRTKILACECMRYTDYFDVDGVAKPFVFNEESLKNRRQRRAEFRRMKCYNKAVHLKLTPLTSSDLTSEGGRTDDPYYLGRTKAQYESDMRTWDVVMRLGTSLVFGYYGVEMITDFCYATLIWRAMQISLLLLMGMITKYTSFLYMTDEYRGRIVKKIDYLIKFENETIPKEEKNYVN